MFSLPPNTEVTVRILDPNAHMPLFITRNPQSDNTVKDECEGEETCDLPGTRRFVVLVNALRQKTPLRLVEVPMPIPQHKRKRWMSEAYHQRIQKKWNKRFTGRTQLVPETEPVVVQLPAATMQKIAERIKAKSKAHYGL